MKIRVSKKDALLLRKKAFQKRRYLLNQVCHRPRRAPPGTYDASPRAVWGPPYTTDKSDEWPRAIERDILQCENIDILKLIVKTIHINEI